MTLYLGFSTLVFLFLTLIWNKENLLNFLLKVVFCSGFLWGLLETLYSLGYLVHK
jgi:hypothetical protein